MGNSRNNPNVRAAWITGLLGLSAAVVAGLFQWFGPTPTPAPTPGPVVNTPTQPLHGPIVMQGHTEQPLLRPLEEILPATAQRTVPKVSNTSIQNQLASSPVDLITWVSMSSSVLSLEERENLFSPFFGKQVTWEGYYGGHRSVQSSVGHINHYTLTLYDSLNSSRWKIAGRALPPPTIQCWLAPSSARLLEALKPGQRIVVRGLLKNKTMLGSAMGTDLMQCEILAVFEEMVADKRTESPLSFPR